MASPSARRQAANAALKLLQPKVNLVTDLAEAGGEVDAAERAVEGAQQALAAKQAAYMEKYRAARAGGWTDEELTRVGWPAERGGEPVAPRRRRRRPEAAQQRVTPQRLEPSSEAVAG